MRFNRTHLLIAVILLAASTTIALGLYSRQASKAVDTVAVTKTEIIRAVYATGVVEPVHWTVLSPEKTGRLAEIIHYEGEKVTKGDVVARMDSRVVEERLHEAKEHLGYTVKEVERYRAMVKTGAVSRSRAEDAERAFGEARERVHTLNQEISDLRLIAAVSGMVLRREVEVGQTVQAGQAAFWVGSPKPLRVTAEVDEEDISQVRIGQTALIKADAFPDQVFEGTVDEITPQGDPVNKVFRVRIALPDKMPLMINMTVEVNIVTERIPGALVIPAESESQGFVWRIENGKRRKTTVTIGKRNDAQLQVLKGLQEGDLIVRMPPAGE